MNIKYADKPDYCLEVLQSQKYQKKVLMTVNDVNVIIDMHSDDSGLHVDFHQEGYRGPTVAMYNVGDKA